MVKTQQGGRGAAKPFHIVVNSISCALFHQKRMINQEWLVAVGPGTSRVDTEPSYLPARAKPDLDPPETQTFCPQMARRNQGAVVRTERKPRKSSNHLQNFGISFNLDFKPPAFKAEIQDPHTGRVTVLRHPASLLGLLGVFLASITLGGSCCVLLDFLVSAEKNNQCQSDTGCGHSPEASSSPWILERVLRTGEIPHSHESSANGRRCRQTYEVHMNL